MIMSTFWRAVAGASGGYGGWARAVRLSQLRGPLDDQVSGLVSGAGVVRFCTCLSYTLSGRYIRSDHGPCCEAAAGCGEGSRGIGVTPSRRGPSVEEMNTRTQRIGVKLSCPLNNWIPLMSDGQLRGVGSMTGPA